MIDLVVDGKPALVIGQGREAEFKIVKLLDAGADVTALGSRFSARLRKAASRARLVVAEPSIATIIKLERELLPRAVFISTENKKLDEALVDALRTQSRSKALIYVVDRPRLNDFNMPALGRIGDIRLGVSTGGKSPAMAAKIRDKLERAIDEEDVLQVRLQSDLREEMRKRLKDHESKRDFVHSLIRDRKISSLLKSGRFSDARRRAEKMLEAAEGPGRE